MSEQEAEVEDLGYIRLKESPSVEQRHGFEAGQVHKVIRRHKRGSWIQGDGEPVMILWREAEKCEPPA